MMRAMNLLLPKAQAYETIVNAKVTKIAHVAARPDPSDLGPRQMVQVEGLVGPVPRQLNFVVVAELRLAVHDPDHPMLGLAKDESAEHRQDVAAARRRPVPL